MTLLLRQAFILLVLATVAGLGTNLLSSHGIPIVGTYRDLSSGSGPIVPPSAEAGDPPFIDINVAQMEHAMGKSLFVDARSPEDFSCGTIPGSRNIPFEMLPEGDLSRYFDSTLAIPRDYPLIIFCSGEECDLSLHLARNLQLVGYTSIAIFFGGAREWERFGFEMERRKQCGG